MRLYQKYQTEITKTLMKDLKLKNTYSVPKVDKIVVNIGLGQAVQDKTIIDKAVNELSAITGQKPRIALSKKAVASFKLRAGVPIGVQVTLRKAKMYDFMEKLFNLVLPRLRDFKGVSNKSFDGRGNYTIGLEEQTVFPEIDYGKIERVHGLEITFVTSAKTNDEAKHLLELLGMSFAKK